LKEEEAFWLARRRLGPGGSIALEFAKAMPGRLSQDRLRWLTAGVWGAYVWTTGFSCFSNMLARQWPGNDGAWLAEMAAFWTLTGALIWLAVMRPQVCLRRVEKMVGSPWRMALVWLVLAGLCVAANLMSTPGLDGNALAGYFHAGGGKNTGGGLMGMYSMFTGEVSRGIRWDIWSASGPPHGPTPAGRD